MSFKMKNQIILWHFVPLAFGSLIYVFFRDSNLILFKWLEKIYISGPIFLVRSFTYPISIYLPNWFLYSLPDGLWIFSLISILLIIWKNTISKHNLFWFILIPTTVILLEIGQFFGFIAGTFDLMDIIFYLLGTILPFLIFTNLFSFTMDR